MYRLFYVSFCLFAVLASPVRVLAAAGKTDYDANISVTMVFLLLALWGICKCFAIAKRPKTNTKCAVSLGLSLSGYWVISAGVLTKKLFVYSQLINAVLVVVGVVLFIVSTVLAIIGLLEYKRGFTQGKKQAVWALVVSSVFILAVGLGAVQGFISRAQRHAGRIDQTQSGADIINADLNFIVKNPEKPYIKLKPKTINPYASVALFRASPQVYYILIAEQGGVDMEMTTEDLIEISQAALKSGSQSVEIGEPENVRINGMDGVLFASQGDVNGRSLSYRHWVCSYNGYLYQQIAFTERKNEAVLQKDAIRLFRNFRQKDTSKVCYSVGSDPFGRYESAQFGYRVQLQNTSWTKWTDINEKIPGADIGGQTGNETAVFAVSVLPIGKDGPGDDAIIGAFLQSMSIDRKNQKLKQISDPTEGIRHTYLFGYSEIQNGVHFDYKLKIVVDEDRAFMLVVWADPKLAELEALYKQVEEATEFFQPTKAINIQQLDDHGKLVVGDMINRLGIHFDNHEKYKQATKYFSAAVTYDPTDEIFWDNAMKGFNQLNDHQGAIRLIEKYYNTVELKDTILSWYAWHLWKNGDGPGALSVYRDLFSSGYDSKEDFKYYVDLLAELRQVEAIDPSFAAFMKGKEDVELRFHQADIWYKLKEFEKALAVLGKLDQKSDKVVLEKIYNLQALQRYKEILQLCNQLIDGNQKVGDAYYHKGKAEYGLKWYAKSKASFELALEKYPKSNSIKDYLKELSGILGQGDNSVIKRKIAPVPLPNNMKTLLSETFDPAYTSGEGAYYLQRVTGYQYESDGKLKSTLRRKIHIVDSVGANNFSTFTIDFNPLYEQLHVNSLVVRNREGKVIAKGKADDYYIVDLNEHDEKSHEQTLNIPIPQLTPGSTFEIVATKILGNYNTFPFRKNILASRYPVVFGMVYVMGNTDKIMMKGENGVQVQLSGNEKIAYVRSPVKYRQEPQQVDYHSELPLVYINGTGNDWRKQGEAYLARIRKQMIITDDIKKLSQKITDGIEGKARKIDALYRYLQDNFKYMGIEFGTRGQIPYEASVTVKNKYGDCKDHALLFHHLLEGAGVENYLALVNIDNAIQVDMPSRDQFNHIINYIPSRTRQFWDATDKDSSSDLEVPMYLSGSQALVLEPGNVRFKRIPDNRIEDSLIQVKREYRLKEKALIIKEELELNGFHAAFMRNFLKRKSLKDRQAWGQATVHSYFPSGKLEDLSIIDLNHNSKPLKIALNYSVLRKIYTLREGFMVNTGGVWESYYLLSEPVKNRQTGFEVKYPFRFVSQNVFHIPKGTVLNENSGSQASSKSDFGSYGVTFQQKEKRAEFRVAVDVKKGKFDKSQYQSYYQFGQEILKSASPSLTFSNSSGVAAERSKRDKSG